MNENPAPEAPRFPIVPRPFDGRSAEVEPGACFEWIPQGWAFFIVNPGVWVGAVALPLVILIAIGVYVPIFGTAVAHMLLPLFGAGMLQICRRIAAGEEPMIADAFVGFQHNGGPLIMVGLFFALCMLAIAFIVVPLGNAAYTGKVLGFSIPVSGVVMVALMVSVSAIPVLMATWFAPALIFLHDMKPAAAMQASLAAGIKNWQAMLVFGIFLGIGFFFSLLSAGLGFILLVPVTSGAVYASYRDIFLES